MNQNNKKTYKATFLIDTRKLEQPVESLIEHLKNVVETVEGEVVGDVENLGIRNLVRGPDASFATGLFLQIDFNGTATTPTALHKKFHLNKNVNRILIETL